MSDTVAFIIGLCIVVLCAIEWEGGTEPERVADLPLHAETETNRAPSP